MKIHSLSPIVIKTTPQTNIKRELLNKKPIMKKEAAGNTKECMELSVNPNIGKNFDAFA